MSRRVPGRNISVLMFQLAVHRRTVHQEHKSLYFIISPEIMVLKIQLFFVVLAVASIVCQATLSLYPLGKRGKRGERVTLLQKKKNPNVPNECINAPAQDDTRPNIKWPAWSENRARRSRYDGEQQLIGNDIGY
ncbi:hypothetical protein AC249_AIPGENE4414 [Exaiptasia diaphana]|nr:hypothetical protein AC249_AIPGENE4414 [Exaiptasia diaphana]